MTDRYNQTIDARDLNSRLSALQASAHNPNPTTDYGEITSDAILSQRCARSTSTSSSSDDSLSHLPRFAKSATVSTTDTGDTRYSSFSGLRAEPSAKTHRESAQGTFNKPRVHPRSRRDAQEQKEFKYYGRHGNQWLFNDFSVTHAVSKGFKRVFGKEEKGDWYENRER